MIEGIDRAVLQELSGELRVHPRGFEPQVKVWPRLEVVAHEAYHAVPVTRGAAADGLALQDANSQPRPGQEISNRTADDPAPNDDGIEGSDRGRRHLAVGLRYLLRDIFGRSPID